MYHISKRFEFSASHQLKYLPPEHQCARLHGHNYAIEVEVVSPSLNKVGFVKDYGELAPVKTFIDDYLDHRHLNDVVSFNPTAELLAKWVFEMIATLLVIPEPAYLYAVRVHETPKTCAEYRP